MKKIFNVFFIIMVCLSTAGCDMGSVMTMADKNNEEIPKIEVNNKQDTSKFNFNDTSQFASDDEKVVEVSTANVGRKDPFRPYNERLLSSISSASNKDSLILPPDADPLVRGVPLPPEYNPDSPLIKLIKVKISGILYDPEGSSAILNIDGEDYVVHEGDKIFDFRVNQITPDKVAVAYGKNIYKKGVGEMFTGNKLNTSPIKGINNMYAGKKNNNNNSIERLPDIRFVSPTTYL